MRTAAMVVVGDSTNTASLPSSRLTRRETPRSVALRTSRCRRWSRGRELPRRSPQGSRTAHHGRRPIVRSACESFTRTARPSGAVEAWRPDFATARVALGARRRLSISVQCRTPRRKARGDRAAAPSPRRGGFNLRRVVVILASHGRQAHDRARLARRRAHPPSDGRRDRRAVRRNRQPDLRRNSAARRAAQRSASPTSSMTASRSRFRAARSTSRSIATTCRPSARARSSARRSCPGI